MRTWHTYLDFPFVIQMAPNLHLRDFVRNKLEKSVWLVLHVHVHTIFVCILNVIFLFTVRSPYLATSTPYLSNKKRHAINYNTFSLHEGFNYTTNHQSVKSISKDRCVRAVKATGIHCCIFCDLLLLYLMCKQRGLFCWMGKR